MKLLASLLGLGVSKLSPFSDDVLYTIDFVGEKAELDTPGIKYDESDFVIMKTPHNEEYKLGYLSDSDFWYHSLELYTRADIDRESSFEF